MTVTERTAWPRDAAAFSAGLALIALIGSGCGAEPTSGAETTAAECSDGIDNDADGLLDCADPACGVHAHCMLAGDGGGGWDAGTPGDAGWDAGWDAAASPVDSGRPPMDAGGLPDGGPAVDGGSATDIEVVWEQPGLVPYGSDLLFPTYLAHLFGAPVTHPVEMETVCASVALRSGSPAMGRLSVRFPGYAVETTQDVMITSTSRRHCLNPVFDLEALYALRALTSGRIEATLTVGGVEISTSMTAVRILPGNDIVWLHPSVPLPSMRDLSSVYVVPHDPRVEALLTSVQGHSVFPGGFGATPYARTPYERNHSIAVGAHRLENVFLEAGESLTFLLNYVDGGSDDDIDVYLFTPSQYSSWLTGGTAATRVWPNSVTSASGTFAAPADGWYVLVLFNTNDNFVSRTVRWTRSVSREDVARDALQSIFTEMQLRSTTYLNIPGTYFSTTQHIKRADEVISSGSANCIDGSLLFASLLELIGMEPVIIYVSGHAYVGVRSAPGSSVIWPVETTLVGSDTFWNAYNYALGQRSMEITSDPYYHETDVWLARAAGITPVPR